MGDLIGNRVRIIYQDLTTAGSKIGELISKDSVFLEVKLDNSTIEVIPVNKLIRMEIL